MILFVFGMDYAEVAVITSKEILSEINRIVAVVGIWLQQQKLAREHLECVQCNDKSNFHITAIVNWIYFAKKKAWLIVMLDSCSQFHLSKTSE